jgi:hypothetical protein
MTSKSSFALLVAAVTAVAVTACAEGAKIDGVIQGEDDDGDGGSRGDGGRRNDGGGRGDGGDSSSSDGGSGSASPTTSSGVGSSGSAASSGASSSQSSGIGSASSSAAQSSASSSASSSSSGGGPVECNAPLDPAQDCGAGQHCFPTDIGVQPTCSPAGNAGQYDPCASAAQCAPIYGCVPIVEGQNACCLQFCTNDFDCPGFFDLCYPFQPPQYAGGVQYGVCFDGADSGC